jgi:hypothetical protein
MYWDIEDEQLMKKLYISVLNWSTKSPNEQLCKSIIDENNLDKLKLKHGDKYIISTIKYYTDLGLSLNDIFKCYEKMPDLHLITNMFDSQRYDIIKEKLNGSNKIGFCFDTLFGLNKAKTQFSYPNEVKTILRYISDQKSSENMDTTIKLDIYNNKIEVFIALLFDIYNRYIKLNINIEIINHKKNILNQIFKILLDNNILNLFNKYYNWIREMDEFNLIKLKKIKLTKEEYPNLEEILGIPYFFEILDKVQENQIDFNFQNSVTIGNETVNLTNIKNSKIIMSETIEHNGLNLKFVSDTLKNDEDFVLKALAKDSYALQFASDTLKNNRDFILKAIDINYTSFFYASSQLKSNKLFLYKVYNKNWKALAAMSDTLKSDQKSILKYNKNI